MQATDTVDGDGISSDVIEVRESPSCRESRIPFGRVRRTGDYAALSSFRSRWQRSPGTVLEGRV